MLRYGAGAHLRARPTPPSPQYWTGLRGAAGALGMAPGEVAEGLELLLLGAVLGGLNFVVDLDGLSLCLLGSLGSLGGGIGGLNGSLGSSLGTFEISLSGSSNSDFNLDFLILFELLGNSCSLLRFLWSWNWLWCWSCLSWLSWLISSNNSCLFSWSWSCWFSSSLWCGIILGLNVGVGFLVMVL